MSGIKVGSVSDVSLQGRKALVTFTIDGNGRTRVGHHRTHPHRNASRRTRADSGVRRATDTMHPMDVIPVSRTSSPYSLTEAVSELTTQHRGHRHRSLNQSLDTLSATLDQIAPQLGPTFDGITRLSQSLNDRNDTLATCSRTAADVTGDPFGAQRSRSTR